jgi:amidohydrolase
MSSAALADFRHDAYSLQGWIVERRRYLHRHPELSFKEAGTSAFLASEISALGLTAVRVAEGRYGFYADIVSPLNPRRFIGLRADMDALPIGEETGLPFSSATEGVGHLCGHDAHSSMLLGAARLLVARQATLPYSVRLIFQHAEELPPGGAIDFVKAGAIADVEHCFALHVSPRDAAGTLATCKGPICATTSQVSLRIQGRGGHAAHPHEARDPLLAAAIFLASAQQTVARRNNPLDPAVVSFCSIHGGAAHNVIPESVTLLGTTRALRQTTIERMTEDLRQIAQGIAMAHGCEAHLDITYGYPAVVNDAKAVDILSHATRDILGAQSVREMEPVMGGEDFAYYGIETPSAFGFLGAAPPDVPYHPLHHPKFYPHEDVLWSGAAILARCVFASATS